MGLTEQGQCEGDKFFGSVTDPAWGREDPEHSGRGKHEHDSHNDS